MYGVSHFFNGFAMLGFTSRFIIALVILSYLYSKSKSDKSLKRGLVALVVFGVIVLISGMLLTMAFLAFGGFGAIFSRLLG